MSMNTYDFPIEVLPDIEIYGGDTSPWHLILVREDGKNYTMETTVGYTCKLTITPFKVTTGLGDMAHIIKTILTKSGKIQAGVHGEATALFEFSTSDTKGLRGKYIYQVEVESGAASRICQGRLYIRQNINR